VHAFLGMLRAIAQWFGNETIRRVFAAFTKWNDFFFLNHSIRSMQSTPPLHVFARNVVRRQLRASIKPAPVHTRVFHVGQRMNLALGQFFAGIPVGRELLAIFTKGVFYFFFFFPEPFHARRRMNQTLGGTGIPATH